MSSFSDRFPVSTVHGHVRGRWVAPGRRSSPVLDRHNLLSYAAADVLAAAYGGDTTRIPKYVGFVYSDSATATLPDLTRDMDMAYIDRMVEEIGGNMQVVRFSRAPSVSGEPVHAETTSNDNSVSTRNNVVEFHAVTRTGNGADYVYPTSGTSSYCGVLKTGKALHRAVLLGDTGTCSGTGRKEYTVLAMVDLKKNGQYRKKPEDYELALDWRVTFE